MSSALFATARTAVKGVRLVKPAIVQPVRNSGYLGNVVAIPCRDKFSNMEKLAHISVMLVCWLSFPIWVLVHVKEYNGSNKQ